MPVRTYACVCVCAFMRVCGPEARLCNSNSCFQMLTVAGQLCVWARGGKKKNVCQRTIISVVLLLFVSLWGPACVFWSRVAPASPRLQTEADKSSISFLADDHRFCLLKCKTVAVRRRSRLKTGTGYSKMGPLAQMARRPPTPPTQGPDYKHHICHS